jgi:cell division protein FtsL
MLPAPAIPSSPSRRPRLAGNAAWALPRNVPIQSREEAIRAARWAGVFGAVLIAFGLGHALLSAQTRELNYDRMATLQVVRRLELEARDLEAKIESLNRHDRIERIARDQLGMVRPAAGQKRVLP